MEFQKRLPVAEKSINEIEPEKDIRVKIIGKVVGLGGDSFVVDDGSGSVQVTTDPEINLDLIKVNDSIKVIGRVFASENSFELRAESLQNVNGIDAELLKKVRSLEREHNV
ncbi:MAG: OB-fold nucleic acid binding domain-containing protein [Candidatus Aenigmarchaeota archaeon]|nr:OB-fold nucleic acid binding domain-containing protein [Candidatus Aenigmarchaeota archaeon]